MKKEEVKRLLGLGRSELEVDGIKVENYKGKKVKMIYVHSNKKKVRCNKCNKFTSSIHNVLEPSYIRGLDIVGQQSVIKISKRRFFCNKCKRVFTEKISVVSKGTNIGNQLIIQIHKDLLEMLPFKYIAKKNNVSITFVINELESMMKDQPEYLRTLPEVISFDEFKADTDKGKYAFIINDPINKRTLDILPNRTKDYLIQYFTHVENRSSVKYVISDMYEPYLIVTKTMFPKAKFVVDRFHFVTYIMDSLDEIRIRTQEKFDRRTKEYKILKNKKNVSLLRKYSNEIDWFKRSKRYKNGHLIEMYPSDILEEIYRINEDIKRGYELKELFLQIINECEYKDAKKELEIWIELARESNIQEFVNAAKTIENWLDYIVNSFVDKRFSNGYTEGLNNKIKVLKRISFGFKKFKIFRYRLLYIFNGILK